MLVASVVVTPSWNVSQGLPPEWESVLKSSGISRDQVSAHPQEVLDVLQFHMDGGPPPKLPKKAALAAMESKASVIKPGDPSAIFKSLTRLGEGYCHSLPWLAASAPLTLRWCLQCIWHSILGDGHAHGATGGHQDV